MALVEQLGDDSKLVCATCYHMALVFAIIHLYIFLFYIASVHSFFIFFFNLVSIN